MKKHTFHPRPAGPVRHGHGAAPIDEQARHYTVACLEKLHALLNAEKIPSGESGDDYRLQFTVARFLLELGWGRNPLRTLAAAADDLMSPEEQEKLRAFITAYTQSHDPDHSPASAVHRTVSGGAGAA